MFIRSQLGRSMVEMLGVLAIIGVLSVGGISGYRYAMLRNKVNNFIYYLQIDLVNAEAEYQSRGFLSGEGKITMPEDMLFTSTGRIEFQTNEVNNKTRTSYVYYDIVPESFYNVLKSTLPYAEYERIITEQTSASDYFYLINTANGTQIPYGNVYL